MVSGSGAAQSVRAARSKMQLSSELTLIFYNCDGKRHSVDVINSTACAAVTLIVIGIAQGLELPVIPVPLDSHSELQYLLHAADIHQGDTH